jgi:hypothetical protein
MRAYSAERSLQKVKEILTTEEEAINKVIDDVIQRGVDEGLSIPKIRGIMKDALEGDELATIENWQAERIARTEVGSAMETGSFDSAMENGEGLKKEWLHSGIYNKGYRESHVQFMEMGPQDMDYEYAPGLKFACDPEADPGETINCRCATLYTTGD